MTTLENRTRGGAGVVRVWHSIGDALRGVFRRATSRPLERLKVTEDDQAFAILRSRGISVFEVVPSLALVTTLTVHGPDGTAAQVYCAEGNKLKRSEPQAALAAKAFAELEHCLRHGQRMRLEQALLVVACMDDCWGLLKLPQAKNMRFAGGGTLSQDDMMAALLGQRPRGATARKVAA